MFYSRPAIEPLGWDLVALPTPSGSRNFVASTSDGHPLDFRFSSGWLIVERGDAGASADDQMKEVLSMPIAPFGITDISAEQICDILGLTVEGDRPEASAVPAMRGFDWSGRTTYWCSTHAMMSRDDAELLAAKICDAFEGVVLLQPVWLWQPPRVRCRRVTFLLPSDEYVYFAIGCDSDRVARLASGDEIPLVEFDSALIPKIYLMRTDHGEDLTGTRFIRERSATALALDYEVIHHRRYRIWVEYPTDDVGAQAMMARLLQLFDSHFCRGLELVDLETGETIGEECEDEEDTRSYSVPFSNWCRERPGRYLHVGMRREEGRVRFIGFRPISSRGGSVRP